MSRRCSPTPTSPILSSWSTPRLSRRRASATSGRVTLRPFDKTQGRLRSGQALTDALIVLGIDPGIAITGYGIVRVQGRDHTSLGFGAIRAPDRLSRGERLLTIYRGLLQVIRQWKPHEVAVEDFYAGHVRAAVAIGEA